MAGVVSELAELCASTRLTVVLLLSRKSRTYVQDRVVAEGSPNIIMVHRALFTPGPNVTAASARSLRTPVLAAPVSPEEALAGEVTVAGIVVPTVERWMRAVTRLRAGIRAVLVRAPHCFRAYRRQLGEALDVGPDEAWEVVGRYVPRISTDAAMTIFVVVATLYRISQTQGIPGETFRDAFNSELSIHDVLREKVLQVLLAGHLENRALVLGILFEKPSERFDFTWVSVYSVGFAIAARGDPELEEFVRRAARVKNVPRLLGARDVLAAVRSHAGVQEAKLVYFRRLRMSDPVRVSAGFRQAIDLMQVTAQEAVGRIAALAFWPSNSTAHRCLLCHETDATQQVRDSVLPIACTACAREAGETVCSDEPEIRIRVTREGGALTELLVDDVGAIHELVRKETDLEVLKDRFLSYADALSARDRFLEYARDMERRAERGVYRFDERVWYGRDYQLLHPLRWAKQTARKSRGGLVPRETLEID